MKKIALVSCVRSTSTRFPQKFAATLAGKPLAQHTIDFARALGLGPLSVFTRDEDVMRLVGSQCPIIYEPLELYDTPTNTTYEKMRYVNSILDADLLLNLQVTQPIRDLNWVRDCLAKIDALNIHYAWTARAVDGKDIGIFYCYSREHLESKQEGQRFVWWGPWFDVDTPDDLRAAQVFLDGRKA